MQKHYTEIEDFLADESFQIWVQFSDDQKTGKNGL
jgi:hypothetical protein